MLPEARPEEEHGSLEQGEYTRQNVLHSISLGLAFGLIFVFSLFLVLLEERKGKERKGKEGKGFRSNLKSTGGESLQSSERLVCALG